MENRYLTISYLLDLEENSSYSLLKLFDDDYKNCATMVIKDSEIHFYNEDGTTMEFGDDLDGFLEYCNISNYVLHKLTDGASHWKEYNPNPKQRNIGDCSLRAYCAAFDIDWNRAYDIASEISKNDAYILNVSDACNKILIEYFKCTLDPTYNKKTVKSRDRITVNEFAMSHPYGTYVLHTHGHLVTCKNGQYYDSWDSGKKKVDVVYIVPNKK